jgi:putative transposase
MRVMMCSPPSTWQWPNRERIQVDNGPQFIAREVDLGAKAHGVVLDFFSRANPPKAFSESFNRGFKQDCLNEPWFLSLEDDKEKIEAWRRRYLGWPIRAAGPPGGDTINA